MFNKKLHRRIKALEDYLGILFSPAELKNQHPSYGTDDWGIMKTLNEMIEKYEQSKKK